MRSNSTDRVLLTQYVAAKCLGINTNFLNLSRQKDRIRNQKMISNLHVEYRRFYFSDL